jgi:endonuclease G
VRDALNRAVSRYLSDPNVSLIDYGLRIHDRRRHRIGEEMCVRIHVRRKLYGEAFNAFAARYPERVIDASRIGVPVDVPQADYRLRWWSPWSWYGAAFRSPRARIFSPLRGGISVSSALHFGHGTLGGKVTDRETGRQMILSNWHVLAYAGEPGVPIFQPGRSDGGSSEHTVAHLARHAMDDYIDAAVAELNDARPLDNNQLDLGPVTGPGVPALGMRVVKSGRGTGITRGVITGIEGRQAIVYGGVRRVIRHTVHIAPASEGTLVSAGGDSGSWWLDETSRLAVALHFAGSDDPEYGLAVDMPRVLDALHVNIVPGM